MRGLVLIVLAGAGAQLVDGSLGMGYGVTSASLLLALGTAPALASAAVNLAQVGTTFISGASHHRFGNVEWTVVRRLAVPGAVGGLAGATFLSGLSTQTARPVMAVLLLVLAVGIIARFSLGGHPGSGRLGALTSRRAFLTPLGLVGGFVNATGGGGWGPVVTSTLLSTSPLEPRRVIGSVSASECVVTLAASVGFVVGLGLSGIDPWVVGALTAGGVVAAPLAARLAGLLPAPILGVCVGGLILLLNLGSVLELTGVGGAGAAVVEGLLATAWLAVLTRAVLRVRAGRTPPSGDAEPTAESVDAATTIGGMSHEPVSEPASEPASEPVSEPASESAGTTS
jgi:uncharacterized protein